MLNRLKELTSDAGGRGAIEALAILLKFISCSRSRSRRMSSHSAATSRRWRRSLSSSDEQQGKEGAEHVAANGHVAAVVDGASGQSTAWPGGEILLDPQSRDKRSMT